MKVTILGCGGSGGVPLIGCTCPVCTSTDPRNKRSRVSIVVEQDGTRVLVDTSPDLRQQFLANSLSKVDAVVLTHSHADHLHGIDDLRSVNFHRNAPLDIWADKNTLAEATTRFGYAFNPPRHVDGIWYAPSLRPRELTGKLQVGPITMMPFRQEHGGDRDPTLGLRFGRFAYSTDVKDMPEAAFEALEGVEVWVVDCLQERPNVAHSHLEQTLGWIARVKPKRAILTHMNHTVDYAAWQAKMPKGVEPAYDGMVLQVD
jgi:phosphoribosyl 1,2-cyclic phosphate phosphodiesterase